MLQGRRGRRRFAQQFVAAVAVRPVSAWARGELGAAKPSKCPMGHEANASSGALSGVFRDCLLKKVGVKVADVVFFFVGGGGKEGDTCY